jgi:hypothetical protein
VRSAANQRQRIRALTAIVVAVVGVLGYLRTGSSATSASSSSTKATSSAAPREASSNRVDPRLRQIGFRSPDRLRQHFQKHGAEFGAISEARYLSLAQDLRDAPLSKVVIETEQKDGTVSRFDRATGAFIAFDRSLIIRTFFRPNDGERYFWRAAGRSH